ncbi:hypothetical protein BV210_12675 [Halorientalis sp. IM1011]|uniref:DUF1611 domain-containing protein n=1 Tax=Halorientalis sp. IM1011 TaxID=1932360 RepID=UPI00097CCD35|nr:DUF1611 domain-containing protein [Halorientalis sp. IM1011]AQL43495.1 hypothetical protein BV210_12675 [Halorientalis sp. IM1011]
MNVAVLAHERFPDRAKTAVGVLRYADYDVTAVLDRDRAGERVADHLPAVQDAPIVAGIDDVPDPVDALVIGIAPIGGGFDESWRPDVRGAIERGCDVLSGLHYYLAADEEFAALADDHGVDLRDLRRPPEDLTVAEGRAREVDADVVATVGTDCSTGKMTTSVELVEAARQRGIDAALIPTGQTGVLIEDWGIVVDRVASDFVAGAIERMVSERGDDHDLLVVEGQGSITHPAYSAVTCGILHGAMPDGLVLCHEAGRERIHGYESFEIPPVPEVAGLYEDLAAPVAETTVAAGSLNTRGLDDAEANQAVIEYATAIDAPATDPVRFGADELLDALL